MTVKRITAFECKVPFIDGPEFHQEEDDPRGSIGWRKVYKKFLLGMREALAEGKAAMDIEKDENLKRILFIQFFAENPGNLDSEEQVNAAIDASLIKLAE